MYESIVMSMNANVMHNHPLVLGKSVKIEYMYIMINQSVIDAVMVNLFIWETSLESILLHLFIYVYIYLLNQF
jgi:hypothetical protein